jgi:N-acyl amino acid synthase of PEP-CTERM/exosortase system
MQSKLVDGAEKLEPYYVRRLDGTEDLYASFALRYQVYCCEKQFLSAEEYPDGYEKDDYDSQAIHLGAFAANGQLVGTVRLVLSDSYNFPLKRFCRLSLKGVEKPARTKIAEISRLAISKNLTSQVLKQLNQGDSPQSLRLRDEVRVSRALVLELYKALYQESKRYGVTHWLAAMEQSLARLLWRHQFLFHPVGPEVDYYGLVRPYMAHISHLEAQVFGANPEMFAHFMDGLAKPHRPVQGHQ